MSQLQGLEDLRPKKMTDKYMHTSIHPSTRAAPNSLFAHHFDRLTSEVCLCDRRVITLHNVDALAGQGLDDRLMGLEGGHLVSFENEAAHPTVEFTGQQQPNYRGFDVLLFVLVCVERVPQVFWDVI